MAFDAEGRRVASGSTDNTVRGWYSATGARLAIVIGLSSVSALQRRLLGHETTVYIKAKWRRHQSRLLAFACFQHLASLVLPAV